MPKIYNGKFILVQTYTPEDLLTEDGKMMDERPLMSIAINIDWLRLCFKEQIDPDSDLEVFLDEEATYDSFEEMALTAIQERWFAFAVYDDGEEKKTLFPKFYNYQVGTVEEMMEAYRQYMLEETVFEHICRTIRNRPISKENPAAFMEDGQGCLVFGTHYPKQYEGEMGAEQAFIDILRRCGEVVSKGKNGTLQLKGTF